ncbi:hypothetical protein CP965_00140 [Halarcobacter mediterraneus]|uniref:Uncharacterized protein n=1 Tax=Halarcobacter mediterraneus TaxID=2023153 RepID=A0A4Q1AX56_9BACT|nr:hypothetical protein [Halarcobacter mediterraneus]RXK13893.1 hypothetical protein CP965_00140 [Halarcobacter mediterraneus]
MELVIILIFLAAIFFLVLYFSSSDKKEHKSQAIKKEELILKYEKEMKELVDKYKNNNEELSKQKIQYLKKASNELHNNIFFDESEAKALIKKLASF